jgi:CheY-like chemotaxis protein
MVMGCLPQRGDYVNSGLFCDMRRGALVILLVEDDENDLFFVQRATSEGAVGHKVYAVHDGSDAIRYLRGEGDYADRQKFPIPNVILTDIKMPGMGGFDFLRWLRSHPESSVIPVIVYSNSNLEKDVTEAYRLGANAYIKKPSSLNELIETLDLVFRFWSRCESPPMKNA